MPSYRESYRRLSLPAKALLAALLLAAFLPRARAVAAEGELLSRKVLALYDRKETSADYQDVFFTLLHGHAELPLNHLGLDLVYQEIGSPLPEPRTLDGYRGILTWFPDGYRMPDPARYCRWLEKALDAGLKVVVLGETGLFRDKSAAVAPACRGAFAKLGVEFGSEVEAAPWDLKVVAQDRSLFEFERRLDAREFSKFRQVRALPEAAARLRIQPKREEGAGTDAAVMGPRGAVVLDPFVLFTKKSAPAQGPSRKDALLEYSGTGTDQYRWRLDPFRFFAEAFAVRDWPRPDVTTVNGRRLFFSHVDGDGFFNVSELDRKSWSAEVLLREVVQRHPDSPFTLSLITGYFDLPRYATPKALELSRRLLASPNVEAASHGYTHPLQWHKRTTALDIPGYRFDARREIIGSLDFINRELLPAGKTAALFQWTGNCLPLPEDAALLAGAGILNINGGDSRFDRRHDSVAFVAPIGRPLGKARQIYSGASNENTYTDLWRGPFYGYREVLETFARTEDPRRLKPVDVYFHFYSAEKAATLRALASVLEWARRRPLFPVFAGEYARLAESFYRVSFLRQGPGRFAVEGPAQLRTIRFDGESRTPDLDASLGVLGFKREKDSLYVSLAEEGPWEIALSSAAPSRPFLMEANFRVLQWSARPQRVRFLKKGWWRGELMLGGLPPGRRYRIREGGREWAGLSGPDGVLAVAFADGEGAGPAREVVIDAE